MTGGDNQDHDHDHDHDARIRNGAILTCGERGRQHAPVEIHVRRQPRSPHLSLAVPAWCHGRHKFWRQGHMPGTVWTPRPSRKPVVLIRLCRTTIRSIPRQAYVAHRAPEPLYVERRRFFWPCVGSMRSPRDVYLGRLDTRQRGYDREVRARRRTQHFGNLALPKIHRRGLEIAGCLWSHRSKVLAYRAMQPYCLDMLGTARHDAPGSPLIQALSSKARDYNPAGCRHVRRCDHHINRSEHGPFKKKAQSVMRMLPAVKAILGASRCIASIGPAQTTSMQQDLLSGCGLAAAFQVDGILASCTHLLFP